jgi:hypothetical protein
LIVLSVSVGGDNVGVVLRSANTLTFNGTDLDVTSITPAWAPGVSHDPVVLTILSSPTDDGDGVIDLGSASRSSKDTRSVQLEGRAASSKSNTEDTLLDTSLVLGNRSWLNSRVGAYSNLATSGFGGRASTCLGSVWILSFEDLWGRLEVVPGPEVPSTLATMGFGVAVNELLLRESKESTTSSLVSILGTSSGSERPAGTA